MVPGLFGTRRWPGPRRGGVSTDFKSFFMSLRSARVSLALEASRTELGSGRRPCWMTAGRRCQPTPCLVLNRLVSQLKELDRQVDATERELAQLHKVDSMAKLPSPIRLYVPSIK